MSKQTPSRPPDCCAVQRINSAHKEKGSAGQKKISKITEASRVAREKDNCSKSRAKPGNSVHVSSAAAPGSKLSNKLTTELARRKEVDTTSAPTIEQEIDETQKVMDESQRLQNLFGRKF